MAVVEGGCLCGAIRYAVEGEPLVVAICHCTHCQKQSGSAFSVVGAVRDGAYRQTGETKVFADTTDSGKPLARHFCGTCGSPIVSVAASMPGLTIVKAGTLDRPADWVPTVEAYGDHAVGWFAPAPTRPRLAQGAA